MMERMYSNQMPMRDSRDYATECGPETACMDPYTTQISNRLAEAEKYLTEITIQLSRIADKLVGAVPPTLNASLGNEKNPTPVAMMEQIVGQANILNRKIHNLGDTVNRLQSL